MEKRPIARRSLLKGALATTAVWTLSNVRPHSAAARDYTAPVPESENLSAYLNGGQLLLRWNNVTTAAYRASPAQKYPYLHPLCGPVSGLPLTSESSLPYPHHRGVWLGCDPLNGGNYWSDGPLEEGQIRSTRLEVTGSSPRHATLRNDCEWIRPAAPSPLRDERELTFRIVNDRIHVVDVDLRLFARQDITIKRAKHSLFAMRCAPDIAPMYGGTLINSEGGIGAKGTYGKPAAWCGYFGRRAQRPDVVEGIAIFDHPENPWAPCPWFTREYGHLSPSPFNYLEKPWHLQRGKELRLRYRVVLHAGDPKSAGLDDLHKAWLA